MRLRADAGEIDDGTGHLVGRLFAGRRDHAPSRPGRVGARKIQAASPGRAKKPPAPRDPRPLKPTATSRRTRAPRRENAGPRARRAAAAERRPSRRRCSSLAVTVRAALAEQRHRRPTAPPMRSRCWTTATCRSAPSAPKARRRSPSTQELLREFADLTLVAIAPMAPPTSDIASRALAAGQGREEGQHDAPPPWRRRTPQAVGARIPGRRG